MSVVIKRDGQVTWHGDVIGTVERVTSPSGSQLWKFKGVDESAPHDVTTNLRGTILSACVPASIVARDDIRECLQQALSHEIVRNHVIDWLRNDVGIAIKMSVKPQNVDVLVDRICGTKTTRHKVQE